MTSKFEIHDQIILNKLHGLLTGLIDEELVMMNIEKGEYYGLTKVASRIWMLLDKEISYGLLIETLLKEYEISEEVCRSEVQRFLIELEKRKLIRFSN